MTGRPTRLLPWMANPVALESGSMSNFLLGRGRHVSPEALERVCHAGNRRRFPGVREDPEAREDMAGPAPFPMMRPYEQHPSPRSADAPEAMMPVYFFNQRFQRSIGIDAAGIDLPNLKAVRRHAVEMAREIMADEVLGGEVVLDRSIEVTNASGKVVMLLPFADVAALRLPRARPRGASPARQRPQRRRQTRPRAP